MQVNGSDRTINMREKFLHILPLHPARYGQPRQGAVMWWMRREHVCGTERRARVLMTGVLVMVLCSQSVAGHCLSHISVTGGATVTGDVDTLCVTLLLQETTEVGRLLYRLAWDEDVVAPRIPEPEEFHSYFHLNDSVSGELRVLLKRSLVGLPDYPMLKGSISALVYFPMLSDGKQCSVKLSHLLQDDNTHAPTVRASRSFLQVTQNFPVFTPLQGFTVIMTDNDAAAPNNQMELGVEGSCPLAAEEAAAATTATEETEARWFSGTAGQKHITRLHLTSPLHEMGNETFTCTLKVTDMGSPPLSSSVTFIIQVVDAETPITTTINTSTNSDTSPHLALPLYLAEVWPGMDAGTPLATFPESVKVNGGDPMLTKVTYTLRDAWPGGTGSEYFAINSVTGEIRLKRPMSATLTAAEGDSGGGGGDDADFVPLVIQAQDSSGRISTAVLQVKMSHPQPCTHTASPAACLCSNPGSRGRASLGFSRLSYAAKVFPSDTFVGRVEARLVGRLGELVRYSWAPGTNTTSFIVNDTNGVINVAPAGVSPGPHLLTVRATVGSLTATAQVTVRVLEEKAEEERKTKKQQYDEEDMFMGLRSGSLRTCDPEDLMGLQVAVGVLASMLGLVVLAAVVAGVLLYRRRKAKAQTEVKHISTLGSAYPNLSFSRDSPE